MSVIKVTDFAYGRLRAPDLDVMEEFLTHFGMLRAERTQNALYMRGTDPAHHIHVTEKGNAAFVGLAYYAASADDLKVGQTVKLWLSPPKEAKKSDSTSGDTTDKSTPSATQVNRPRVRMALIQEESDLPEPKEPKQKKKKQ